MSVGVLSRKEGLNDPKRGSIKLEGLNWAGSPKDSIKEGIWEEQLILNTFHKSNMEAYLLLYNLHIYIYINIYIHINI